LENDNDCSTVTNCDPEKDPKEMLEEITCTGKGSTISLCSITDSMVSISSSEVNEEECMPPYYGSTGVGYSNAQSCQCSDSGDSGNSIVDNDDTSEGYSVSSRNSVL